MTDILASGMRRPWKSWTRSTRIDDISDRKRRVLSALSLLGAVRDQRNTLDMEKHITRGETVSDTRDVNRLFAIKDTLREYQYNFKLRQEHENLKF
jgi:hypothetical protein